MERFVIMLAGLPGSGKTIVADYLVRKGFERLVMGDVVRNRLLKKGLPVTRETMMNEAKLIRKDLGPAGVAELLVKEIEEKNLRPPMVIDGLRSIDEARVIVNKVSGCHFLVYIHSSPKKRFQRLTSRGREGDPISWEDFLRRDIEEISFGLSILAIVASHIILNEGPIDKLYQQVDEMLEELSECNGELLLRYP